ncbi:protein of unknown function (plasmid) [Azospirillum baldaniorum]|uniref:Uncharacterized protein n=1 Tax=Azospirillum baldaniorum TaxID=1064539 RepID=A0A9P1JXK9_9PROT|nr:protein of unknown function [Azospirillum baldaniorum]
MGDQRRRGDHPAGAPAGHGVRLGQAVDGHRALRHAGKGGDADVGAVEGQAGVDLVGDDPQIVAAGEVGDGLQFLCRHDDAGGVGGGRQEYGAGARGHRGGQRRRVQPERGGVRGHRDQRGARRADTGLVGQVHRLRHQHLVPRFDEAEGGVEQAVLRPGADDDVLRLHRQAGAAGHVAGQRGAQLRTAGNRGVVGVAGVKGGDGGVAHRGGRVEIRVADAQHDHVLAAPLGGPGGEMDVPGRDAVAADAVGEGRETHRRRLPGRLSRWPDTGHGASPSICPRAMPGHNRAFEKRRRKAAIHAH